MQVQHRLWSTSPKSLIISLPTRTWVSPRQSSRLPRHVFLASFARCQASSAVLCCIPYPSRAQRANPMLSNPTHPYPWYVPALSYLCLLALTLPCCPVASSSTMLPTFAMLAILTPMILQGRHVRKARSWVSAMRLCISAMFEATGQYHPFAFCLCIDQLALNLP